MPQKEIISYFSGLSATIKSVKAIQKVYEPQLAYNFNSFNFLKPDENKYSKILAFFLDPAQSHGQGDIFLKLFLKRVGLYELVSEFDSTKVVCKCEHIIDNQRRIDILIKFENKFVIAVENKIWARDQKSQLKDYKTYLQKNFADKYCLLYLTPYQIEPSTESTEDPDFFKRLESNGFFKLIGYTEYIIDCIHDWAINCRAERVRSFLLDFEKYLNTEFLGQTFMEENQIIVEHAIKNGENLEVAFATANALSEIKKTLLNRFKLQIKEIADANNLMFFVSENLGLNESYSSFSFYKESWKSANIVFQFASKNANDLKYGICLMADEKWENPRPISERLTNSILKKFNRAKEKNDWWLFSDYFEISYRNWSNQVQPWIDIQNGDIKKKFDPILKEFITNIGDLQL